MLQIIGLLLASIVRWFRARRSLLLENLVLRQQLAVLKRKHPRPRLGLFDKAFGSLQAGCGPDGGAHLSSLAQKPWSAGAGLDLRCIGG